MVRWGILGAGNIARKFAADLSLVKNAKLVAVGSRSKEKAEAFAKEFPAQYVHGTYESLAANQEVDAIYVASPHSHHHEHTLMCIENGKAVLCEKAFAVNHREALEMVQKAKEKNILLMEAMWTKFLPHYQKTMSLLKEGVVGDIGSVLINFGFRPKPPVPQRLFDPALAGGTILDIGIYNAFMAMSILGRPDEIEATMTPASTGVDEQCAVLFKYKNGAIAQLFSTFTSQLATDADINGSRGRLRLTTRFYAPECTLELYPDKIESKQLIDFDKPAEGWGYQYEAQHFTDCFEKGLKESPVMTHEDTLIMMEVLDEIRSKAGIRYAADR